MKTLIIFTLLFCFLLACEGDRGPMGPSGLEGIQGPPGEDVQIISITGSINYSRNYGFFEIFNPIIRADDAVDIFVRPASPITAWATTEYAFGDGFALIYDPNYSLIGWYYLVRIIPNADGE